MALEAPPELHQGFWYVTPAVADQDGNLTPGEVPGAGWTAWYAQIEGVWWAAVRLPDLVVGVPSVLSPTVDQVLAAAGLPIRWRPHGRIRGR